MTIVHMKGLQYVLLCVMNEARKKCYRRTHSLCLLLIIHVNKKWTKNIFEKRNELKIYTNLFLKNFFAVFTWSIYSFKYVKFTKFCGVLNLENVRGLSPETKLGCLCTRMREVFALRTTFNKNRCGQKIA